MESAKYHCEATILVASDLGQTLMKLGVVVLDSELGVTFVFENKVTVQMVARFGGNRRPSHLKVVLERRSLMIDMS